ncbi:uncharacterized protein LOC9305713 [Arabidopsis lyrata subsp. lyrata]|uniref:uncharacterized protein LOC9305713 n=1 Tax=Arabidopsis lyrata subsp. lyrata TaxID=81972 RepID=UPI000A29ADD2|nr:uncharacterized protein LOC9305713 [Arabidopsis lyrata subsp. lyrata]|eukprot:XP_020873534.1 uncharacterized protein LOC9305713 [Arabidopsis lyrata subsp. lyrata]
MYPLSINRLFKPSVCKNLLRHKNVRLFSSTSHTNRTDGEMSVTSKLLTPIDFSFLSTPIYPFLLIDYVLNLPEYSPDGRVIRTSKTGDPAQVPKTTSILIRDKKLAEEVRHAMTVGFSHHGLGFKLSENSLDILIDDQESTPSCVHLPSLPTGFRIQSLAMSSSSSDLYNSEDWVVCVKSWGSQLSLFRRGHEWINIQTSPEFIHPFSSLMYSKKDQRFYIPAPGGNYLCCLDLYFKEGDQAEFIPLFDIIPESVGPELTPLNSSSRTDHWVESPSGEQFLVKWYGHNLMRNHNKVETLVHMASQFMVFRAEESWEEKYVYYTEDIGDLCIFLGHSEAFCIQASSCPGLKPNCIYFVGYNFGVYDLTTKTCTIFYTEEDVPLRNLEFPYWPPPVSLYS